MCRLVVAYFTSALQKKKWSVSRRRFCYYVAFTVLEYVRHMVRHVCFGRKASLPKKERQSASQPADKDGRKPV